jgi:hypothetical protein
MKKYFLLFLLANTVLLSVNAQDEEETKNSFFKKENIFIGGAATGGFGNGIFSFGIGPHIGYSFNDYIDVALALNYSYYSQRDLIVLGDKLRQSIIGPSAFVRIFPVDFIYVQAQIERNFSKQKYIFPKSFNLPNEVFPLNSTSYLIGAGITNGRDGKGTPYSYISILVDIGNDLNSPYIDQLGRKNPIFRAGLNIPLFQGGNGRRKKRNNDD